MQWQYKRGPNNKIWEGRIKRLLEKEKKKKAKMGNISRGKTVKRRD